MLREISRLKVRWSIVSIIFLLELGIFTLVIRLVILILLKLRLEIVIVHACLPKVILLFYISFRILFILVIFIFITHIPILILLLLIKVSFTRVWTLLQLLLISSHIRSLNINLLLRTFSLKKSVFKLIQIWTSNLLIISIIRWRILPLFKQFRVLW